MRSRLIAPLVLGALACAGCGTTTVRHVTTTITRPASDSSSSTASSSSSSTSTSSTTSSTHTPDHRPPNTPTALTRRSPAAILQLAAAALRSSGGYAMHADLRQAGTRTIIDLTADSTGRYAATLSISASSFQVVDVPGAAYLRGNEAFWRDQAHGNSADARRLADHWLHVPARSVTGSLGTLRPGTLARCLTEDHGTLSITGFQTVDGRRALVVRDAGDAPGATPSTYAVAASGPPYMLRYEATGATRRGGRIDVCNDGKGDGATGTIALSQFGSVPSVQAPAAAGSIGGGPTT